MNGGQYKYRYATAIESGAQEADTHTQNEWTWMMQKHDSMFQMRIEVVIG